MQMLTTYTDIPYMKQILQKNYFLKYLFNEIRQYHKNILGNVFKIARVVIHYNPCIFVTNAKALA